MVMAVGMDGTYCKNVESETLPRSSVKLPILSMAALALQLLAREKSERGGGGGGGGNSARQHFCLRRHWAHHLACVDKMFLD
jgi:hypothetical protein